MKYPGEAADSLRDAAMTPAPEEINGWFAHLTARELAWLIVRLREFANLHTWVSAEKAEARIRLLRAELFARGEVLV